MGKYSAVIDGKALPFRYENRDGDVVFRVGEVLIGQLFKTPSGWAAVSSIENLYGVVYGFKTRLAASEYLLQVCRVKKGETK